MRVGNGRLLAFNAAGEEADAPFLPARVSRDFASGKDMLCLFSIVIRSALEIRCTISARTPTRWFSASTSYFGPLSLSNGHRQLMPVSGNFQPGVLLDLARLQGDAGDVKARIFLGLNVHQLGGIESPPHSVQGTDQRSLGRPFLRQPQASSLAGAVHPQEVPALLANHGVENRCRDLFYARPVFADRLRQGIERFRKNALFAQENGMRFHARALFATLGVSGRKEPGK